MSVSTTECKSLPYHIYNDSTLMIFGMDAFNLTKNPYDLTYSLLLDNTKVNITKVTETFSLPECNPQTNFNFYDIASIFKQGDYFELAQDDYYFVERITSNKIVMSRIHADTVDVSCELDVLPGTISGPFLFSPSNLMAIGVIGNTYQFFYTKGGIVYNWNTITKLTNPPTHVKCPSFANTTSLEVKNVYNLNSAGKLLVSVVMNDTILGYYGDAFDNTGLVYQLKYTTGNITTTTFNIKKRYSTERYNAQPFFFDGTELFVLSKEGNFMQGYFFGEYHDFPTDLNGVFINPKKVKYGKIGSNSYLFYPKFIDGTIDDIYSYDLNTKTSLKLSVIEKIKNYFNDEWIDLISEFIFKDNKLVWNYVANFNALIYYDVTTTAVGSFELGTLSSINNDICFTCQGGFQLLLSSNNELMLFALIGNRGNVAITFQPVTNKLISNYNINGDLYLQNPLKGELYQYKADNNLIVYEDILNGRAICSTYKFKQFDKYVYTSNGKVTEISKCSNCINDTYIFYFGVKILSSTAAVPTCIQKASLSRYTTSESWTIQSSDTYYISNGLLYEKESSLNGVYVPFEEPLVIYLSQYEASSKKYVLVGNRKPIIYDMSIKKAINYVDIESEVDSLCGVTDWNIDDIVLRRSESMACIQVDYTCYDGDNEISNIQNFQISIDGKLF